jgi:hypothetical protein
LDIPKQMMSEPFTAMFNGMLLNVSQVQSDNVTTSLFLNGSHLDLMELQNQTSEGGGGMQGMDTEQAATQADTQRNAIVITAAVVVPEFPLSVPLVATAAGFSVIVFFFSQKRRRF